MPLRTIAFIVVVLIGLGSWACEIGVTSDSRGQWVEPQWRRTSAGWQRPTEWAPRGGEFHQPTLHPALVASLELLISLIVMVAADSGRRTA